MIERTSKMEMVIVTVLVMVMLTVAVMAMVMVMVFLLYNYGPPLTHLSRGERSDELVALVVVRRGDAEAAADTRGVDERAKVHEHLILHKQHRHVLVVDALRIKRVERESRRAGVLLALCLRVGMMWRGPNCFPSLPLTPPTKTHTHRHQHQHTLRSTPFHSLQSPRPRPASLRPTGMAGTALKISRMPGWVESSRTSEISRMT